MITLTLATLWVAVIVGAAGVHRPVRRWAQLVPSPDMACSADAFGHLAAIRLTALCGGAIVVAVTLGPVAGLGLATSVAVTRRWRTVRQARRGRVERNAQLPAAIDLLVMSVAAGLTPRHGLGLVAERGPPAVRPAFGAVVARLEAGEPLAVALPRLVDLLGEPARPLVRAVTVAERDGTAVRTLLARLADDARRQRRQDAEAAIRRLPVRLSFPLVCCVLPAFVVLTVVPLLASGLRRLSPLGP